MRRQSWVKALNKDAGTYSDSVYVSFTNGEWYSSIGMVCDYTITKAPLSIFANNGQRFYGEENPELACSYVGFKNGETNEVLDVQPMLFTTATTDSYVGTYPIYCSGAEAKNYEIAYEQGLLTIAKAPQAITWEQEFSEVTVGDEIELNASCSSGAKVKYTSSDSSIALISTKNGIPCVYVLKEGIAAITASQAGDSNHEEAEDVSKILKVKAEDTGIDNVSISSTEKKQYYDLQGRKLSKPQKGVNIINGKKILLK